MRFFASAPFAGAIAIADCLSAALGGFLLMNTLYLQDVRGLPAMHAGLFMLPTAAMMIVFAPVSGHLTGRFGARPSLCAGGLAVMATTSRQAGLTLGVAVFGVVAGQGSGGRITPGFAHATRPGWWIVATLGLTVAALGYLTSTARARGTARRNAGHLEDPGLSTQGRAAMAGFGSESPGSTTLVVP